MCKKTYVDMYKKEFNCNNIHRQTIFRGSKSGMKIEWKSILLEKLKLKSSVKMWLCKIYVNLLCFK